MSFICGITSAQYKLPHVNINLVLDYISMNVTREVEILKQTLRYHVCFAKYMKACKHSVLYIIFILYKMKII